jgi:predicted Zn-dependent peptidase
MDAEVVSRFHGTRYRGPAALVSAAGAVDEDRLHGLLEGSLRLPGNGEGVPRKRPEAAPSSLAVHVTDLSQLHLIFMAPAPAESDPDREAVQLLAEIFGGGMSSRLFQSIREDAGLAYAVQTYSEHFQDSGIISTYLAVSPRRLTEALERTLAEMRRLVRKGLAPGELDAAKAQVRGSTVMGMESLTHRMSRLARNEFTRGRHIPVEETLAAFEAVTETAVLDVAARLLDPDRQNLVALGPAEVDRLRYKTFGHIEVVEES